MQRHFSRVASAYRDVRTTDIEPILFIKEKLGGRDRLRAGDIGCGAGRYGRFILEHLPLSGLTCIDANTHMLKEAKNYLDGAGSARTHFLASRSENLPLLNDMFDCLFTFNAVHHFDLGGFLHQTGAALKKSGCLFIYTRLPGQNEASIWGKYFPGFNEKETRLMALEDMKKWIPESKFLSLEEVKIFQYRRDSSLEKLLSQVREKHYSTFSLYTAPELEIATEEFKENLHSHFSDMDRVHWQDGNVMLVLRCAAP